jgi:DNA-binding transcriptional ArsR family regulator
MGAPSASSLADPAADKETERRARLRVVTSAPFRLPDQPSERELLGKYFRTFGDPTRLHILELLLRAGELSVGELVAQLGSSQPRTSAHLACLRWCGFVTNRREHRTIYYRLADERIGAMLDLARELLSENSEHVAACRRIDGA